MTASKSKEAKKPAVKQTKKPSPAKPEANLMMK